MSPSTRANTLDPRNAASSRSLSRLQTERAMQDLETFLRAEEGIEVLDVRDHVAPNLPDSTTEFRLEVDVAGGTSVRLLVGDYGGKFYVEVRRTTETVTTCLKFREIVSAVRKHAHDWA